MIDPLQSWVWSFFFFSITAYCSYQFLFSQGLIDCCLYQIWEFLCWYTRYANIQTISTCCCYDIFQFVGNTVLIIIRCWMQNYYMEWDCCRQTWVDQTFLYFFMPRTLARNWSWLIWAGYLFFCFCKACCMSNGKLGKSCRKGPLQSMSTFCFFQ